MLVSDHVILVILAKTQEITQLWRWPEMALIPLCHVYRLARSMTTSTAQVFHAYRLFFLEYSLSEGSPY